jgi:hypothetical protein
VAVVHFFVHSANALGSCIPPVPSEAVYLLTGTPRTKYRHPVVAVTQLQAQYPEGRMRFHCSATQSVYPPTTDMYTALRLWVAIHTSRPPASDILPDRSFAYRLVLVLFNVLVTRLSERAGLALQSRRSTPD